jgi:GH15 family glucan-1,4-alpha-glucosidase
MLGNGSLTVGLNEQGLVNDFYYPYVGLDNLNTSRSMHHRIGVWVDGTFSWVDDGTWIIDVSFESTALVSTIRMQSHSLGLQLDLADFVDSSINAFCRRIVVSNQTDHPREVRLFMHQVFEISRRGRGDTALYVPEDNYILDYKGRCALLIYGQHVDGTLYDQFSIGNYNIEGKEGTYKDAEDGELSGNAVEHGGVDTVIRFLCNLEAGASQQFDYWVIAADSQYAAQNLHYKLKSEGLDQRLENTRDYWRNWLKTAATADLELDKPYLEAIRKSLMVIKAHMDRRGGIIASCDSSIYNFGRDYYSYVWPRDGAYAMWPLIKLGYRDEPKLFFEFCRDIMHPDGYLMHKYQPDRAIGSTWHPLLHGRNKELAIQEDETAIIIVMLGEYLHYSKDQDFVFSLYNTFIQPAANFIASFKDEQTGLPHASYDLWEEKFATHTYTAALSYKALEVAAVLADTFEYPDDAVRWRVAGRDFKAHRDVFFDGERKALRKSYLLQDSGSLTFDNTLDISSLYGAVMFGLYDIGDDEVRSSLALADKLLDGNSPSGGVPRYERDHYFESDPAYMGNPWFVTTLWLATLNLMGDAHKSVKPVVDWTLKHALPSGVLSEQINPTSGAPLSVTPLVWSHAELINAILLLADKGDKNSPDTDKTVE